MKYFIRVKSGDDVTEVTREVFNEIAYRKEYLLVVDHTSDESIYAIVLDNPYFRGSFPQ